MSHLKCTEVNEKQSVDISTGPYNNVNLPWKPTEKEIQGLEKRNIYINKLF